MTKARTKAHLAKTRTSEPLSGKPLSEGLKKELSEARAVSQGCGVSSHEIERREGGGGIMNTTHKSTVRMSPQSQIAVSSCKETVGKVGPGRNKNASKSAGRRDNYVQSTPPLRDSSHTNRRSNNVPHANPTVQRSTGGRPLPVGVSCNTPTAVLAKPEFGARVTRSSGACAPRTPRLTRGSFAARENRMDLSHKAETYVDKRPLRAPSKDAKGHKKEATG